MIREIAERMNNWYWNDLSKRRRKITNVVLGAALIGSVFELVNEGPVKNEIVSLKENKQNESTKLYADPEGKHVLTYENGEEITIDGDEIIVTVDGAIKKNGYNEVMTMDDVSGEIWRGYVDGKSLKKDASISQEYTRIGQIEEDGVMLITNLSKKTGKLVPKGSEVMINFKEKYSIDNGDYLKVLYIDDEEMVNGYIARERISLKENMQSEYTMLKVRASEAELTKKSESNRAKYKLENGTIVTALSNNLNELDGSNEKIFVKGKTEDGKEIEGWGIATDFEIVSREEQEKIETELAENNEKNATQDATQEQNSIPEQLKEIIGDKNVQLFGSTHFTLREGFSNDDKAILDVYVSNITHEGKKYMYECKYRDEDKIAGYFNPSDIEILNIEKERTEIYFNLCSFEPEVKGLGGTVASGYITADSLEGKSVKTMYSELEERAAEEQNIVDFTVTKEKSAQKMDELEVQETPQMGENALILDMKYNMLGYSTEEETYKKYIELLSNGIESNKISGVMLNTGASASKSVFGEAFAENHWKYTAIMAAACEKLGICYGDYYYSQSAIMEESDMEVAWIEKQIAQRSRETLRIYNKMNPNEPKSELEFNQLGLGFDIEYGEESVDGGRMYRISKDEKSFENRHNSNCVGTERRKQIITATKIKEVNDLQKKGYTVYYYLNRRACKELVNLEELCKNTNNYKVWQAGIDSKLNEIVPNIDMVMQQVKLDKTIKFNGNNILIDENNTSKEKLEKLKITEKSKQNGNIAEKNAKEIAKIDDDYERA